eukprot:COSAG01_NODE_6129_length_3835_cov_2.876907_5_plen_110_part_00
MTSVEARQEATAEGGDSVEHTDSAAGADAQASMDAKAAAATEDALGKLTGKEAAALTSRLRSAGARLVLAADLEKMGDVRMQMRHFLLFSDGTLLFTKRGRRGACELRR